MRILVTGKTGGIGRGFQEYMKETHRDAEVVAESLRGIQDENQMEALWESIGKIDAVYYCVGVVNEQSSELFAVNSDLAFSFAKAAKKHGVSKFIYLSSMAVYGFSDRHNEEAVTLSTIPVPAGNYGKSKLEGEKKVGELADSYFEVDIIRAPSIFGRQSEAYLDMYIRAAKKGRCFDMCRENKRSALYIDNLSELVYLILCKKEDSDCLSYYLPQNKEAFSWIEFVYAVSQTMGIPCRFIKLPKAAEKLMMLIKKYKEIYRKIMYDTAVSACFENRYCVIPTEESIRLCIKENKKISE